MKKISERAIEIMVDRNKKTFGPTERWGNFNRFYSETDKAFYPGLSYVCEADLAQALDEYQKEFADKFSDLVTELALGGFIRRELA